MKIILLTLLTYQTFQHSHAIDCEEVITRAKNWVVRRIPYSMSKYTTSPGGGRYRTDCSGFVSMAWKLSSSLSTVTLTSVSKRITKNQLRTGDIVMKGGPGSAGANGHVVIFDKWTDNTNKYWAYEQTPPRTVHRIVTYPYYGLSGYLPYRYDAISCGGGGQCSCCKGNAFGEFCGHELCGSCSKDHIYGCNKKGAAPSIRYGVCRKGCTGSTNSRAKCNK